MVGLMVALGLGCGGETPAWVLSAVTVCHPEGLGAIYADTAIDCVKAEGRVDLALSMLLRGDPATGGRTVIAWNETKMFKPVAVHVVATGCLDAACMYLGAYHRDTEVIELSKYGGLLLHEMLHHVEHTRGVSSADSVNHLGWHENGFYALDGAFQAGLGSCLTSPGPIDPAHSDSTGYFSSMNVTSPGFQSPTWAVRNWSIFN